MFGFGKKKKLDEFTAMLAEFGNISKKDAQAYVDKNQNEIKAALAAPEDAVNEDGGELPGIPDLGGPLLAPGDLGIEKPMEKEEKPVAEKKKVEYPRAFSPVVLKAKIRVEWIEFKKGAKK